MERASLLCPIRWRKEPCDSQQRNEDQSGHRKVIDHVRKTRGHLLHVKSSGRRLNAKAVVSTMPVAKASPTIAAIFFMAVSLFVVLRLSRQRKDFRDGHHVLELFCELLRGLRLRQASEGKRGGKRRGEDIDLPIRR